MADGRLSDLGLLKRLTAIYSEAFMPGWRRNWREGIGRDGKSITKTLRKGVSKEAAEREHGMDNRTGNIGDI